MVNNDVVFDENGDILDCLSGKALKDTPEERVRQRFINILQTQNIILKTLYKHKRKCYFVNTIKCKIKIARTQNIV